jgi:hypothetical protein
MKQMKKTMLAVGVALTMGVASAQNFTFISPQKPGSGTSVWTDIVVKELHKHMPDDKLSVQYYPGARDIPAINDFQEALRFDNTNIVVSHGGNGVSFLQERAAKYKYSDWDSIVAMNLNIIAAKLKSSDFDNDMIRFQAKSGRVPDAMAITMLECGPGKSMDEYTSCFNDNVLWVKGMKTSEARLAFKRGELNATRENPAAYKKHVGPDDRAELWFHHGILQADGSHADDINYPGYQFEILFENKYGVKPEGRFYNAYKLVKSFRDGLQKAMWVNKDNPNRGVLIAGLTKMSNDPESIKAIEKKVGKYDWVIGDAGNDHRDTLMNFITADTLKYLVEFSNDALGINATYKGELLNESQEDISVESDTNTSSDFWNLFK